MAEGSVRVRRYILTPLCSVHYSGVPPARGATAGNLGAVIGDLGHVGHVGLEHGEGPAAADGAAEATVAHTAGHTATQEPPLLLFNRLALGMTSL